MRGPLPGIPDGPRGTFLVLSLSISRRLAWANRKKTLRRQELNLLWTIAVVLLILWLLGLVSSYTLGGFIHILLVLAIIVILIRVIQGRRVV